MNQLPVSIQNELWKDIWSDIYKKFYTEHVLPEFVYWSICDRPSETPEQVWKEYEEIVDRKVYDQVRILEIGNIQKINRYIRQNITPLPKRIDTWLLRPWITEYIAKRINNYIYVIHYRDKLLVREIVRLSSQCTPFTDHIDLNREDYYVNFLDELLSDLI